MGQKITLLLASLFFCTSVIAYNNVRTETNPTDIEIIVHNASITHAFKGDEPVTLFVWVKNRGNDTLQNIKIKCQILGFNKTILFTQEQFITTLFPNSKSDSIVFEFNVPTPGFYFSNVTTDKGVQKPQLKGFSIEPEKIKSAYPAPKRFSSFWRKTLRALKKVPPQYVVTLRPEFDNPKTDVYSVEMRSLGNVRIHGWFVTPKGKINLPTIVYFQGYTTTNKPSGTYLTFTDYAQFFLDIRGHGDSRKDINPGFPDFLTTGVANKEDYIFRGAYMDCVRSIDFLYTRPEVARKNIVVWGSSMGGALSVATAALDKRVKLCAFDLPFLSDCRNYFTLTGFPGDFFKDYALKNNIEMDKIYTVLDYFDIKNFARSVKCPAMMASGLFDETCPPAINFAAYNNLRSKEKSFYLMPDTGHTVTAEHWYRFYNWCGLHWNKK